MKLPRRQFLRLATGAAALPFAPHVARAQAYPTRPVRIVVTFPAGSTSDIISRPLAQWLHERLGQPFVIDNRPGAGGTIGTETVVRSSPDGYTLLLVAGAHTVNATLYDKLSFNFIRDIAPIAGISRDAALVTVHPSVPAKTVPEFIAYAKANPGKINMASAGVGSPSHVTGELFKMMAGINMVHIPYRGSPPAFTDLIAGQVQVTFQTTAASIAHIRAGTVRALAVTTAARSEVLPDLPSVSEFVFQDMKRVRCGASVRQGIRPLRSSISSTKRSILLSPTPSSRNGSPRWASACLRLHQPTSASSLSMKLRSGAGS
jgi:tripartite-type tricarboxylate transporter receptor subunit TctC